MTVRMTPGYAYKISRRGVEEVIVSEDVALKARFIGYRIVQGYKMGVFHLGRAIYAQLPQNLHTKSNEAHWTSADIYGLYKLDGMTVELQRVRLDRGGYTSSGQYYGTGAPLFTAYGDDGVWVDLRAKDRAAARALIKRFAPNAKVGR